MLAAHISISVYTLRSLYTCVRKSLSAKSKADDLFAMFVIVLQ